MKLAFKVASATDSKWSKLIAQLTHGKYSHVEMWLTGPQNAAVCFSSREGSGCGYATIDLTVSGLWDFIEPPQTEAGVQLLAGFCAGSDGKPYDYTDLLDALLGHGKQDCGFARFCSGVTTEALQKCFGLLPGIQYWTVSPVKLYELLSK